MKVGSWRTFRSYAKLGLLSVMALSLLTTGTVFLRVNATDAAVSPSDTMVTSSDSVDLINKDSFSAKKEETGKEDNKEEKETLYFEQTLKLPEILTAEGICEASAPRKRFKPSATYETCYGDELNNAERVLYDGYVQHFVTDEANGNFEVSCLGIRPLITFDASSYDEDQGITDFSVFDFLDDVILCATAAFTYDYPEAYWMRAVSCSVGYQVEGDTGYLTKIIIKPDRVYKNDYEQRETVKSGLNSAVAEIRQSRSSEERFDTVKAIHDYICKNASYDTAAVSGNFYTYGAAYTVAPLFGGGTRGKKFVCEGYAKAMKLLCNQFDIPCALVSGDAVNDSQREPHMWNYVQMEDGVWYAVDATWDDKSKISYDYFLVGSDTKVVSSTVFSQNHESSGYVMTTRTQEPMAYPSLSSGKYLDPAKISLKTLGASIRLSQPYGIRFGIQIRKDAQWKNAKIQEYGTLIIGSGTLGENELTLDTDKIRRIKAANLYSEDSGQITYTGVLTNIPTTFFDTKVKGRGYLIYKDADGKEQVIYSETVEKSFYGVVDAAYESYSKIQNPNAAQQRTLSLLQELLKDRDRT